jgi:homoserine O-acetyltransferase
MISDQRSFPSTVSKFTGWHRRLAACALTTILGAAAPMALAYDGIVKKEVFTLPSYTTVKGATIKDVRIGYETYGKLNEAKDNVIVICHGFIGNSHAAGKYAPTDAAPGYWDAIIGAGKAFDTDRYFVISTDTLANLNVKAPDVVTTGPATVDPETGKPYGMRFPVISARDMIEVQKALIDRLGIKKIKAVAGYSAGAVQTIEWAAAYPNLVERFVSVIGPGIVANDYSRAMMNIWSSPILLDPKWNNGDYYGREQPQAGVAQAVKLVTFSSFGFGGADRAFNGRWADPQKEPGSALNYQFAIEDTLQKIGNGRSKTVDANHFLYMAKALQLFAPDVSHLRQPSLFIAVSSDMIFPPLLSRQAVESLKKRGVDVEYFEMQSDGGHIDGVNRINLAADVIGRFMAK